MADDFSQYADPTPAPAKGDDFSQYADPVPHQDQTSATEAAGRGFANSASFGVGKWVNAGLGATLNKFGNKTTEDDPVLGAIQASTPRTGKGWWADVLNSVEEQKKDNQTAFNEHPAAYVAGAAAPAVIGGVAGATKLAATGALPSTLGGQVAAGAGVGAAQGATESTTKGQLAGNVAEGAVIGGVATGAVSGVLSKLSQYANSNGVTAIKSTLKDIIDKASKGDQDAIDKLASTGFGNGAKSTKKIIDNARQFGAAIDKDPNSLVTVNGTVTMPGVVKEAVARSLAPTGGDIASDAFQTVVKSAPGAAYDAMMSGGGAHNLIGGLLTGSGATGKLVSDVTKFGTMRYAASDAAQGAVSGLRKASPLAFSTANESTLQPLGLDGILGQYIDQRWATK